MNSTIDQLTNRLNKKIVWPLLSPLYIDTNPDYRDTIFLAGTEKSGTTWISDIINFNKAYRYIFEPFWAEQVSECQHFRPQQYLRPNDNNPVYLEAAQAIFSGRIRSKWTDKYHKRFVANKRLIKDIRANLFLKWIKTHFPEIPMVLLLRHPCAVARSHLRRTHLDRGLDNFLAQKDLVEDFLLPVKAEMLQTEDKFDRLIFRWCIQNYIPLKQFKPDEIQVVFYEHFCETPESEIDRMFAFLGLSYDERIYSYLRKPSAVSRQESAIISGGDLINSWRKDISQAQVERAIEILSLFGLDKIYTEASLPHPDGLLAVMQASSI